MDFIYSFINIFMCLIIYIFNNSFVHLFIEFLSCSLIYPSNYFSVFISLFIYLSFNYLFMHVLACP